MNETEAGHARTKAEAEIALSLPTEHSDSNDYETWGVAT